MRVSVDEIKELREITSCSIADCKKALEEAKGNIQKAQELLRKKGVELAAKKGSRIAKEGRIEAYVHLGSKIGVLLEVNCETDFVAKNEDFCRFTKDVAMHITALSPQYIKKEDVPSEALNSQADQEVSFIARFSKQKVSAPRNDIFAEASKNADHIEQIEQFWLAII